MSLVENHPLSRMAALPLGADPWTRLFFGPTATPRFRPNLGIYEFADRFELTLDLPGVPKEAIHVEVEEDTLVISGQRPAAVSDDNASAIKRQEGLFTHFERRLQLPRHAQRDQMSAKTSNGVLTVSIPKVTPTGAVTVAVTEE